MTLVADLTEDDATAVRHAARTSAEQTDLLIRRLLADNKVSFAPLPSTAADNGLDALLPALTDLLTGSSAEEITRVASAIDTNDDLDATLWGPAPSAAESLDAVLGDLHDQYAARQSLAENGLSCKDAASLLGVREQTITTKIDEGKLIGIQSGDQWRLPTWQFVPDTPAGIVPALDSLQKVFPGGPVALSAWMIAPNTEFDGRTPLQDMLAHGPEHVINHTARLTAAAQ